MATNDYEFVTHWRVKGTLDEVARILNDATALARWWPSVYLEVTDIEPGDAHSVGRVVSFYTKGWLPYTLRWRARTTAVNYPHSFAIEATGDLEGSGLWTLTQEDDEVAIRYDWRVKAEKPLLRALSFALKPFFAANHHWAMTRGEQSLKLELLRRRAVTAAERDHIPAPPPPTPTSSLAFLQHVLGDASRAVVTTST